jgi:outer membrane protein assembly factor BamE (lipoprotein component of BamABCDE complex)
MKKLLKTSKTIVLVTALIATCGCVKSTKLVGYTNESADFDNFSIGRSTKSDVNSELGSPSAISTYGDETWYYVSTEQESIAFLKPKVKSQKIVEIAFNSEGTVKSVNKYTEKDAHKVKISSDETPTEGQDAGVIGQLLGNVGRFNKDRTAPKSRTKP